MTEGPWRRRFVQDLLFEIDGSGWHEPEMRDTIGFRWSGPGRLSVLRVRGPSGAGRGEAQVYLQANEAIPDVAIFLNGHRLPVTARRLGPFALLEFAWDASATEGELLCEFWFHIDRIIQLPAPGERMRSLGFRLSTLTLESASGGPVPGREALAMTAGRRFLADRLPASAGRARAAFRSQGGTRLCDLRLEAARLGPTPQPHLALAIQATEAGTELAIGAPEAASVSATHAHGRGLALSIGLGGRDALLVLRLLGLLPEAFGRWVDHAASGDVPDAELLAFWRRRLGALAQAAEAQLVAAIADGPDPFAEDPARPFAWPALNR